MKLYLVLIFINVVYVECRLDHDKGSQAAQSVIKRLLGDKNGLFIADFEPRIGSESKDTFMITKENGCVVIKGNTVIAITAGFYYYLKNYCKCHVSWDGDQLNLPEDFPDVNETVTLIDKWRYYQNVVTSSYSFLWWNWTRWEREIDWMALNGINIALSFTAQEAIWERVYSGLNFAKHEFTGPAFLAWNRMGNMRNFAGGLNATWHKNQVTLQHKILDRMRELGITPVLPAFAGQVPRSIIKAFPNAKVSNISRWNNFQNEYCCLLLLDPMDPLFPLISRMFLREYIEEFGTDHIYNCDTFNENVPYSNDPKYLSLVSKATFEGMYEIDPKAVWMLQGWLFIHPFWGKEQVEAYLKGVPIGRLLILDLQADLTPQYQRLDSYFGHEFIWCMLHNFGGQLGLYGYLERLNHVVIEGRTFPNSTMVGIGIAPEGIDQNYIMYDFMLDSTFRSNVTNIDTWVEKYTIRRYGVEDDYVKKTWNLLLKSVYSFRGYEATPMVISTSEHIQKNVLTKRPSLKLFDAIWYDIQDLYTSCWYFMKAYENRPSLFESDLFRHDLVDLTRQVIQVTIGSHYQKIVKSYREKDISKFNTLSNEFLTMFDRLDEILKTHKKYLLGVWLENAKALATNINETINYEYNARNQITLWGPRGEIRDYAAKQWSGLIQTYYKPRWAVFISYLNSSLTNEKSLNLTKMNLEIFNSVEKPFTLDTSVYPSEPAGDIWKTVQNFFIDFDHIFKFEEKKKGVLTMLWVLFVSLLL